MVNHPFVDGNKRTALNTVAVFYRLNGTRFEFDREVKTICKRLGTDERSVDVAEVEAYLRDHSHPIDLDAELAAHRDALVRYELDRLGESDPNG